MTDTHNRLETGDVVLNAAEAKCQYRQSGQLDIIHTDGAFKDVHLIPTFPLSHRNLMVAILNADGEEVAFIDDACKLDSESKRNVKYEIERAYFMPKIQDIYSEKDVLGVITLETQTDRGPRTVQIRNARRSIRKLPNNRIVIRDVDSNRYEIPDWTKLPIYGRDLLEQYM
ncbi:MAG: DUF1854 domain-containing protein [Lentisphaeria bacterium]